jgi:hypothetical protein
MVMLTAISVLVGILTYISMQNTVDTEKNTIRTQINNDFKNKIDRKIEDIKNHFPKLDLTGILAKSNLNLDGNELNINIELIEHNNKNNRKEIINFDLSYNKGSYELSTLEKYTAKELINSIRDFPLNKLPDIHENRLPTQKISLKIG